jgi:hypothetical protein
MSGKNRKRPSAEVGQAFHDEYAEPSALYKLLEMNALKNPIFLGRTLSYRAPHRRCLPLVQNKQQGGVRAKIRELLNGGTGRAAKQVKELSLQITQISATPATSKQQEYACSIAAYRETGTAQERCYSLLQSFSFSGHATGGNEVKFSIDFSKFAKSLSKCILVFQVHLSNETPSVLDFPQQPKQYLGPARSSAEHLIHSLSMQKVLGEYPAFSTVKNTLPHSSKCQPIFAAFLNMHEATGKQLPEGSYDLLLQKAHDTGSSTTAQKLGLAFKLGWSTRPSTRTVAPRLIAKIPSYTLYMHYTYDEGKQRQTEIRHDFCCPWCGTFCGSLEGLLCHFTCSHDMFRFQLVEDEWANPHVKVRVDDGDQSGAYDHPKRSFVFNRQEPALLQQVCKAWSTLYTHCTLIHCTLVLQAVLLSAGEAPPVGSGGSSAGGGAGAKRRKTGGKSGSSQEGKGSVTALVSEGVRQYYHSRTGLPLTSYEMKYVA